MNEAMMDNQQQKESAQMQLNKDAVEMQLNTNSNQDTVELVLNTADDTADNTEPSSLNEMVLVVTLDCDVIQEDLEEDTNEKNTLEEQSINNDDCLFDSVNNTINYHNEILMTTTNDDGLDNIENTAPKDNLDFPVHDVCLFDHSYANPISVDDKEESYSIGNNNSNKEGNFNLCIQFLCFQILKFISFYYKL